MPITSPASPPRPFQLNPRKLRELMLYMAARSEDDPHFGAVKLNKLLYFADFWAYRELGRPITGATYQCLEHGPAPRGIIEIQDRLCIRRRAGVRKHLKYGVYEQKRLVALDDADLGVFRGDEMEIVDRVLDQCRPLNALQLSTLSHAHPGWMQARIGEDIPYFTALLAPGKVKLTPAEREWAEGVVARLRAEAA